jgi:predicted acetyltransferase
LTGAGSVAGDLASGGVEAGIEEGGRVMARVPWIFRLGPKILGFLFSFDGLEFWWQARSNELWLVRSGEFGSGSECGKRIEM